MLSFNIWLEAMNLRKFKDFVVDEDDIKDLGEPRQKDGFWGTRGAGILVIAKDTKRMLLGKRAKGVLEAGTWGLVGGAIDPKENPRQAALREFKEETRYRGKIELYEAFVFKKDDFRYYNFIGVIPKEFDAVPDWETEKFVWYDATQLPNTLHFGVKSLLKNSKALIQSIINRL